MRAFILETGAAPIMAEVRRYHHSPSVAIISQSARTDRITKPLETSSLSFEVDPADPYGFDQLIVETPDRRMLKEVLKRPLNGTQLLFRMRGDPYWGINEWIGNGLKRQIALRMLKYVDGCIALAPHQADTYVQRTGNPTYVVPLSRDIDNWPAVQHTDDELRIVFLTNATYPGKVEPIIEAAPTVEAVLDDVGGYCHVCGEGKYEERLGSALVDYEHVHFEGYVDARAELATANLMLHLSTFDSFANAILEGMASNLPVIASDHPPFRDHSMPVDVVGSAAELEDLLRAYTRPRLRQETGVRSRRHVANQYSHERVGRLWQRTLLDFHRYQSLPSGVFYPGERPETRGEQNQDAEQLTDDIPV